MVVEIKIPENSECLLKVGQKVDFETDFVEAVVTRDIEIQVAQVLNIPNNKIFNYLKKFVGDSVEKNFVIAEKTALIGKTFIKAPSKGIIKEIDHNSGVIIFSEMTTQTGKIPAFFKGEVTGIDKKSLKLKISDASEYHLKYASADFGGEIFYLKSNSENISSAEISEKIVFSETVTPYLATKSEALGAKGFVSLKNQAVDNLFIRAQLKNIDDFTKIKKLNLPYCLVIKQFSKIYFYN